MSRKTTITPREALESAVEIAGGQRELARRIRTKTRPIKQAHVWNWLHRDEKVPAEDVLRIETATDGKVTRHQLRPDIYPVEARA